MSYGLCPLPYVSRNGRRCAKLRARATTRHGTFNNSFEPIDDRVSEIRELSRTASFAMYVGDRQRNDRSEYLTIETKWRNIRRRLSVVVPFLHAEPLANRTQSVPWSTCLSMFRKRAECNQKIDPYIRFGRGTDAPENEPPELNNILRTLRKVQPCQVRNFVNLRKIITIRVVSLVVRLYRETYLSSLVVRNVS